MAHLFRGRRRSVAAPGEGVTLPHGCRANRLRLTKISGHEIASRSRVEGGLEIEGGLVTGLIDVAPVCTRCFHCRCVGGNNLCPAQFPPAAPVYFLSPRRGGDHLLVWRRRSRCAGRSIIVFGFRLFLYSA